MNESGKKRTGLNGGASALTKKLKLSTSEVPTPDINTVYVSLMCHLVMYAKI